MVATQLRHTDIVVMTGLLSPLTTAGLGSMPTPTPSLQPLRHTDIVVMTGLLSPLTTAGLGSMPSLPLGRQSHLRPKRTSGRSLYLMWPLKERQGSAPVQESETLSEGWLGASQWLG